MPPHQRKTLTCVYTPGWPQTQKLSWMHHYLLSPGTHGLTDARILSATQIGAFLTSAAGCVVVAYPSDPDPPFVSISAPDAVGNCDDLILEGSASFTSLGTSQAAGESSATVQGGGGVYLTPCQAWEGGHVWTQCVRPPHYGVPKPTICHLCL